MNYLAHLFLSYDSAEHLIGNFITDQITIQEARQFTGSIKQGIDMHRAIDTFTDQHPVVREFIKAVRRDQQKYAPVVVDIYADYLLYLEWEQYANHTFPEFEQTVYKHIEESIPQLPDRIQPRVQRMVTSRWLHVYTSQQGIQHTFSRLLDRVSFDNNLDQAASQLFDNQNQYRQYFNEFFPDVLTFTQNYLKT